MLDAVFYLLTRHTPSGLYGEIRSGFFYIFVLMGRLVVLLANGVLELYGSFSNRERSDEWSFYQRRARGDERNERDGQRAEVEANSSQASPPPPYSVSSLSWLDAPHFNDSYLSLAAVSF